MGNSFIRLAVTLALTAGATRGMALDGRAPNCISKDLGGELLFVRGVVECDAEPAVTYSVVSEYDSLSHFVSAIDSSYVLSRDSSGVLVRQVGTAGLLVRHRVHTVLRFEEHPPSLLRFEIVEGDFATYYGTWSFEGHDAGTRLIYSVTLKPPSFVPHWLARPMLEQVLCKTMQEVAAECVRRDVGARSSSK